MTIVGTADLKPGDYVAICTRDETVTGDNATFTAARAFDFTNLGEFAPLFWFLGVIVTSGLMFLAGIITLMVGLVRRSRARKLGAAQYPGGPYPRAVLILRVAHIRVVPILRVAPIRVVLTLAGHRVLAARIRIRVGPIQGHSLPDIRRHRPPRPMALRRSPNWRPTDWPTDKSCARWRA